MSTDFNLDFPRRFGTPPIRGTIRSCPEDFQVDEVLGFTPDGEGEHLFLQLRKRGHNTQWLARQLANWAGVQPKDVSYAGLKDRQAVTTQWFSVWLPGKAMPEWQTIEGVEVLQSDRHRRKLKTGSHQANRFTLCIRDVEQLADIDERIALIRQQGVPNYFGEQRFGIDGGNLQQADALLTGQRKVKDKHLRGLYLSAARSLLFNKVLAARIEQGTVDQYLDGDQLMITGTTNLCKDIDLVRVQQQLDSFELDTTGPLFGRAGITTAAAVAALETDILSPYSDWCAALKQRDLASERRALRLCPQDLKTTWLSADQVQIEFSLAPGQFATSVLREICDYRQPLAEPDDR